MMARHRERERERSRPLNNKKGGRAGRVPATPMPGRKKEKRERERDTFLSTYRFAYSLLPREMTLPDSQLPVALEAAGREAVVR